MSQNPYVSSSNQGGLSVDNSIQVKNRAQSEWSNLALNNLTGSTRSLHADSDASARGPFMNTRPLSERYSNNNNINNNNNNNNNKAIPKFWVHSHAYSIFSSNGLESMLKRVNNNNNGNGNGNNSNNNSSILNNLPLSQSQIQMQLNDDEGGNNGGNQNSPSNNLRKQSSINSSKMGNHIYQTASLAFVSQNQDIPTEEWEMAIKDWEADGEWTECRETASGRILWYNTNSNRIVFDSPPDGVKIIQNIPSFLGKQSPGQISTTVEDPSVWLKRQIVPKEGEDVVEGLLNFAGHIWNFSNDLVDIYRYQAAQKDHHKMLPKPQQYVFPEYFSETPLPELAGNQFLAKIRLPEEFAAHRRYVTIRIKMDYTTAQDAIQQGFDRLDDAHKKDPSQFILKVVGREEYMYGRRKIIDYEAVRIAVRNEDDVEFVLIKRPDMQQTIDDAREKQKLYELTFQTAYDPRVRDANFSLYENIKIEDIPKLDDNGNGNGNGNNANGNANNNNNNGNANNNKNSLLNFTPQNIVNLHECDWNYRLKIEGLTNVTSLPRFEESIMRNVYVIAELWMGDMLFENAQLLTKNAIPRSEIRWGQWLSTRNLTFAQIPREAVICFMVMGVCNEGNGEHKPLAWCRMPIIDHRHKLRCGKYLLNMWEIPQFKIEKDGPKVDPYSDRTYRYRGTARDKYIKKPDLEQCQLLVEFDEFAFEIIASKYPPPLQYHDVQVGTKLDRNNISAQDKKKINEICSRNVLESIKVTEKDLIWRARDLLWHDPSALPIFLRSVNWTSRLHIAEAHKYIEMWQPPKQYEDALEFLDYRYADTMVREKAIKYLQDMHDGDLQSYLLQLVQCLKYENHHNSSLAKFLIYRGLKNPYQIGHFLFWHLKAEFHNLEYAERFGLIMEEYLKHGGEHSRQLYMQNVVIKKLEIISEKIIKAKKTQPPDTCKKILKKELNKLNRDLPDTIQIPLNPRWSAKKLKIDVCKYMSSKKVPLWLEFENADPYAQEIKILFKSGDDLRQDMLTLQILGVMDKIWLASKLDLHLKPYGVIATGINRHGEGVGMLEIVLNSDTINTINVNNGGAFDEKTINKYLLQHNKGDSLIKVRNNFSRSCSGYCVATFVLGIGDRHSDNIMVSKTGQFFHIDFGHFLGNFKSKFGIKRERSPFVFTPQMKYAIDAGEKKCELYELNFLQWCSQAYNILRQRSRLLLVLFLLMVSAGMPELMREEDIFYFKNMLNLDQDQAHAEEHIHKQIVSSLKDKSRLADNYIHEKAHASKKKS